MYAHSVHHKTYIIMKVKHFTVLSRNKLYFINFEPYLVHIILYSLLFFALTRIIINIFNAVNTNYVLMRAM